MSLMKKLGIKSLPLSVLEIGASLALLSGVCFLLPTFLYAKATGGPSALGQWSQWLIGGPLWLYAAGTGAFLVLVLIYWAPTDQTTDALEVRALTIFIVIVLAGGLLIAQRQFRTLSSVGAEMSKMFNGHPLPAGNAAAAPQIQPSR